MDESDESKVYLSLLDIEKVLAILNKISIFGGLSNEQLYSLLRVLQKVSYSQGEYIYKQGDEPSHIYIVRSGKVKIAVEQEKIPLELVEFSVGQCFGETAVIAIEPHSASAIAVENTELIVLSRNVLLSIFDSDKGLFGILILNIAREACRRLHRNNEVFLHYVACSKKNNFSK